MFLSKLLKLIKRSKFILGRPKKNNLIVFDCETSLAIKFLIKNKDYTLLKIRSDKIDKIYINFEVFFKIFIKFFHHSLKINYLSAIISQIEPKKIVTQYDNSLEFYQLNKIFKHSNIKFIAIQGGIRTIHNMGHLKKNFYIDQYCGFSNYEKIFLEKNNFKTNNFLPLGSISSAAALDYFYNNKINLKKEYNVCLISELITNLRNDDDKKYFEMLKELCLLVKKLKEKKKFSLIICGAGNKDSQISKTEINFYEKIFGSNNFKIDQSNRNQFPSYKNIYKSNLIVGVHSTLMREALGLKKKILIYNYLSKTEYLFMFNDFFVVNQRSAEKFNQKFESIFQLTDEEYFSKIEDPNYYMADPYKTKKIFLERLT